MKIIVQKTGELIAWFIFLLVIDFSLGGISYFILAMTKLFPELERNADKADVFYFIIVQNGIESLIAVTVLWFHLHFIQKRISSKILQYIVLLAPIYIFMRVFSAFIEGEPDFSQLFFLNFNLHQLNIVFSSNILVGAGFLYYWLTREQVRTLKITEQEYQLLQLNELKTKAELEALQAKINPHFLYNALNSIAGLIHAEPDKAEKMVILLAKFFRYSTGIKHQYVNTLAVELDMVQTYLEVEKVRFEDRLDYSIDIEDESLKEVDIPCFLLQPLVENAIKHGISKMAGKGIINIGIHQKGGQLIIHIRDNGKEFPAQIDSGYGLQSTQDKLRLLGGENAAMSIKNSPEKEIIIELQINKNTNGF